MANRGINTVLELGVNMEFQLVSESVITNVYKKYEFPFTPLDSSDDLKAKYVIKKAVDDMMERPKVQKATDVKTSLKMSDVKKSDDPNLNNFKSEIPNEFFDETADGITIVDTLKKVVDNKQINQNKKD